MKFKFLITLFLVLCIISMILSIVFCMIFLITHNDDFLIYEYYSIVFGIFFGFLYLILSIIKITKSYESTKKHH